MVSGIIFLSILAIVYFAYNYQLWRRVNESESEGEKVRPSDRGVSSSHDHERFGFNIMESKSPHHKE
jgi:hypothetical protein